MPRIFRSLSLTFGALLFVGLSTGCGRSPGVAEQGEPRWNMSLDKAQSLAAAQKKLILLEFTGSRWCPACKDMEKDVLGTKAFADYAASHLVRVIADFPSPFYTPAGISDPVLKYHIEAYPSFRVLSPAGHVLAGYEGYQPGGPEAFISRIERLRE